MLAVLAVQEVPENIQTLYDLSDSSNDPDSSLSYLEEGLAIAQKSNLAVYLSEGYNRLAEYWYDRGMADSSFHFAAKALLYIDGNPSRQRARSYLQHGRAKLLQADYETAAKWFLKSLADAEAVNDDLLVVEAYNNLGIVYWYLNDLDQALVHYNSALEISKQEMLTEHTAKILSNLGLIYHSKGQLEEAGIAFEEGLALKRQLNDQLEIAITLQNMGRLYEELENWTKAKSHYLESIAISEKIADHIGIIYTSQNLAFLEAKTGNYRNSLRLLDTALDASKKLNYKEGIKDVYYGYSFVHETLGDYKSAYDNRILHEAWKDSVANEKYLHATRELEAKYENEKKQNQILQLSEANLRNEMTISRKNTWIKTLALGGFSLFILTLATIALLNQRSKLKAQRAVFDAITATEIKEQKRISRDLHDSVGAMLAATKNQLSSLNLKEDMQKQQLDKTQDLLAKTAMETRRIAHNMMPEELEKFGLITALDHMIESIKATHKTSIEFLHFGMENRLDPVTELQLYRIIQEVFQNIQKHAQATLCTLQLTRHQNELNILAEDNGQGFRAKGHAQNGAGLKNIDARVQFLNGSLYIDSQPGAGTTININIPLA